MNQVMPGLCYDIFETRLGWIGAVASNRGLVKTTLPEISPDVCMDGISEHVDHAVLRPDRFTKLRKNLIQFCEGKPISFQDQILDIDRVTPFLRLAWESCRSIPFGETRSYKWLAEQAGFPKAYRAAGQSMARNRFPLVVPCHRVVPSGGGLGGFGKGTTRIALKRQLLEIEATYVI